MMEMLHYIFPVAFAAGSLQYHPTSSSANPNSSLWKYKEAVSNRTCFLGSPGNIRKGVIEKCLERSNTSRTTDSVAWESSLEIQAMSDRDFLDEEGSSLLRMKRYNRTKNEPQMCSLLSGTKAILNPILFPIILILGLALNGILLHIYWKQKELRTQRNVLFMNLAVSDTLFLLSFGVLQFISGMKHLEFRCYPSALCKIQVFFLCVWASVGAYSISLISIQRYLRVITFKKPIIKRFVKIFVKPASLISTVWTLSIVLAIPEFSRSRTMAGFQDNLNQSVFIHGAYPVVLYGLLPFTIAAGFYWAVQRRPLQERLGIEFSKGDRPGRVLLSLGFVFMLTYAPVLVCDILKPGEDPIPTEIYCYISKVLHMLNPVFCPIALCCASSRLRKYAIQYILCPCICRAFNYSPHTTFFEPGNSERRVISLATSATDHRSTALELNRKESTENAVSVL